MSIVGHKLHFNKMNIAICPETKENYRIDNLIFTVIEEYPVTKYV